MKARFSMFWANICYVPRMGHVMRQRAVCVGGPCGQAGLVKLAVNEQAGDVCLEPADDIHLVETRRVTRG